MTDAKREALLQALQFHASAYAKAAAGWPSKDHKQYTPHDVAKTASVFERFLEARCKP
jgi:hypothetical protein